MKKRPAALNLMTIAIANAAGNLMSSNVNLEPGNGSTTGASHAGISATNAAAKADLR